MFQNTQKVKLSYNANDMIKDQNDIML